nr:MAG TPA: hypothetical protein [Caudoviricetes sp.]
MFPFRLQIRYHIIFLLSIPNRKIFKNFEKKNVAF